MGSGAGVVSGEGVVGGAGAGAGGGAGGAAAGVGAGAGAGAAGAAHASDASAATAAAAASAVAPGTGEIRRVWPDPTSELTDDELVRGLLPSGPVLRMNFVSSVDGAVTHEGRSGGLSDEADKRHFELLRRVCDVVLVGAGTVRTEGYGPMRVSEESARWRAERGMSEHPVFALVSGSLDLDPASEIFTKAPVRPIVFTTDRADAATIAAFAPVADVVVASGGGSDGVVDGGDSSGSGSDRASGLPADPSGIDARAMVEALHARGLTTVQCEGGPSLFGSLLAADVVDELFLTIAPVLEAGDAHRIAAGDLAHPRHLALAAVHASGSTLLLRYRRP